MCIMCIEIERGLLLPWEAVRNLVEMIPDMDSNHLVEVIEKFEARYGVPEDLPSIFKELLAQWQKETLLTSSSDVICANENYLRIIGLGRPAVPLILRELEQHPGHLFVALQAITRVNPVPPESQGNLMEMTTAWLEWGRENGFI